MASPSSIQTAESNPPAVSNQGTVAYSGGHLAPDERLRQMELLLNVSLQISAIETLDEVLKKLVDIAQGETGAERATLFLNDPATGELYSRVALGDLSREIRILNNRGIAGAVYQTGRGEIVHQAYDDTRFDRQVDRETGFKTRNILAAPVRTARGDVIGVVQALNKIDGTFDEHDLHLLEALTMQCAITLQSRQFVERMKQSREQEMEFLDVVSDVTSELELKPLLQKIMGEVTRMLKSDRATLFLNDEETNELWSEVGTGLKAINIRFPNHLGIAGAVFSSGHTVNIPYAYADLRFNPAFDKKTGYFTRSILCVPVVNKRGKRIGVTQVLNKKGGPFTSEDETRLKAFSAKISLGLENAKLFADIQNMKNYNESMLESMSNGVVTLDESGLIKTCNAAGLRILRVDPDMVLGKKAEEFFTAPNDWILEKVTRVSKSQQPESSVDAELVIDEDTVSVNLSIVPLHSVEKKRLGTMLMIEDISSEKRLKSTFSRYMDPSLADQLVAGGTDLLGGKNTLVTVLFSDIRGFTTLSEELGPQGTVSMLNAYFTIMVECLDQQEGMLLKFIGDAIMAGFGMGIQHDDEEDRAVRTAIAMLSELEGFNASRRSVDKSPIDIGIGLNTDYVVCGNIGAPKRMDYTVIGDGVNLAARLESACKQYHSKILLSEHTAKRLRGSYKMRDIDRVIVKGKTEPISVFEVLDYFSEESFPHMDDVLDLFAKAMTQYRRGNFDKAIAAFKQCLKLHPGDQLSTMYVNRCEELKKAPPGDDWEGVWVMTSK